MNYFKLIKYLKNTAFFALILIFLNSCGVNIFERKDPIEPEARKRARQNVLDGKGLGGGLFGGKGGDTNFEFATSNPLWRATLDTLDFMVISSVDYAGGLIKISVHKKTCVNSNCLIKQIDTDLTSNIKEKILKKAAVLVKTAEDKKKKKKRKSDITNERF